MKIVSLLTVLMTLAAVACLAVPALSADSAVSASSAVGSATASAAVPGASIKGPAASAPVIETPTRAAPKSEADKPAADAAAEPGQEVIKNLPGIVVDRKAGTVTIDGIICQQDAWLELFACGNGVREHEAVVSIKARPLHVNIAMILLGQKPGNPVTITKDGTVLPPAGPVVKILVEFEKDGKTVRAEAHELLNQGESGLVAKPIKFVYAGGAIRDGQFLADWEGTVICTSNFPMAIFDVPFESSDKNSELSYKTRPEALPKPGTPCKLIIQPTGEVIQGKKIVWTFAVFKDGKMTLDGEPTSDTDLDRRLKERDKYLQRVQIVVDPEVAIGQIMKVRRVVTKYGLEVEEIEMKPIGGPEAQTPAAPRSDQPAPKVEKPVPNAEKPAAN